jgi:hypothetical protein
LKTSGNKNSVFQTRQSQISLSQDKFVRRLSAFLLLLLMCFCHSADGQPLSRPNQNPTPCFLLLCDGLTWNDITGGKFPHLRDAAERGSIALMNCAVAGKRHNTSALLTIATSQRQPAEVADALAANHGERLTPERGDALTIFSRQTGNNLPRNPQGIVHLNLASLTRRGMNRQTLGHALNTDSPHLATLILGNIDTDTSQRAAALLTMNSQGVAAGRFDIFRTDRNASQTKCDDPLRLAQFITENPADFTVVLFRDPAGLDLFLYLLQERLDHHADNATTPNILIVSPRPPDGQNRLTPIIALGSDFLPDLLTSATTRTPGLIANTDIAPTVLALLGIDPLPTMIGQPLKGTGNRKQGTGHPIQNPQERLGALTRLDFVTQLNDQTLHRVLPIFAAVFVFGTVLLFAVPKPPRWLTVCVIVPILFLPAALMLAPILIPPTMPEYALRILAWQAGLTALAVFAARLRQIRLPILIAALNILLIMGDLITGQHLLKDSLLSGYALSGIRYYGIGNEYLGVLLAFVLTGVFLIEEEKRRQGTGDRGQNKAEKTTGNTEHLERIQNPKSKMVFLLFSFSPFLLFLGLPSVGANAGSLVAGSAGFGMAAAILMGRRPTWKFAAVCIVAGLMLAFTFGSIEAFLLSAQKSGGSSHFGNALRTAANQNNAGYLGEIVARKAAMNLRLFLTPSFLAMLGVLTAVGFIGYRRFGSVLNTAFPPNSWVRRGLPALVSTAVAALLFKDSGVVTVAFFVTISALLLLLSALLSLHSVTPKT